MTLDGDNWDIYVIDTDGDELTNVSNAAQFFNTDNSWSPDGRWIASSSEFPTDGEQLPIPNIVAFFVPDSLSGEDLGAPVRITLDDEYEDGAPSVSRDGQSVAFESHRTLDESSPSDLWMIALPEVLCPSE
jgi:Tol biopolymer transport system component